MQNQLLFDTQMKTALINLKHVQKLEMLYEFDVRFPSHQSAKSNLCFTECTKHASVGALIHRQQTVYWIFTQTKIQGREDPGEILASVW